MERVDMFNRKEYEDIFVQILFGTAKKKFDG
jgi:hypothetical protein